MTTRNIRTSEYKSYNDPEIAGLKLSPTAYGIPSSSSVVLSDISSGSLVSVSQNLIPTLATATTTPATNLLPGEVDLSSIGKWLRINHAFDVTYNIKTGFPRHSIITGVQAGTGKILFQSTFGSINPVVDYNPRTRGIGAVFALIHLGNNIWDIMGDLEATI